MRRPGLWVANGHPGDPTQMLSWRPGAITCFYDYLGFNRVFDYKSANPQAPIIIRFQHPHNWHQNPAFFAQQLGQQVASKWQDIKVLEPYVYFANEMNLHYENGDPDPNNQPHYTTPEFYRKYANWVRMTADVIKTIVPEMKLVTPPFAFGHHEDGDPDDDGNPLQGWAGYDYLYETIRDYFDNILTFHAYWGHGAGSVRKWLYDPQLSTWYAFRWQRVLELFETRYNIQARMIIDEAGNFATSDPDFTDQLMYHARKCLTDPRVLALTYFLWHDPTNSPGNLPNSWVQGILNLSEHLNRLSKMPDIPLRPDVGIPKTLIRVLFNDGTVRVMLLEEEYLRAVVPAEMPALWPAEAVKAQAVASRSYAQYAIEHPRHPNADICANPAHCQNYDEARIHPKSDQAIEQTKGIIARYNGITTNSLFSANCGGHTRNNEDVFAGAAVPYLRGVPCPDKGQKRGHGVGLCQYGARAFAHQGSSYDQIIRHYYTGVTLGPPTTVRTSNIVGTILDHTGREASGVKLRLSGINQVIEAVSQSDGSFRFTNVPAGTYRLELVDYNLQQENITATPGQDTTLTLTLPAPPPPSPDVTAEIERLPGLPLIIGDWGRANERILITAPSGARYQTMTGTKLEFGPGGFEIYATELGRYVLEIGGYRFGVPMNGQTARLTFHWRTAGVIEGILRNHQNQPVAGRPIHLIGQAIDLTNMTDVNGYFLFENLPAGTYTVTVKDSELSQQATITGPNRIALALKLAAPPETEEWQIILERGQGLPLLVGDIGLANRPILITSPSGRKEQVTSGSKLEFGPGGFEVYATESGNYIVQFEGQRFIIPMTGQFTRVTFRRSSSAEGRPVRLVSNVMARSRAEAVLRDLLAIEPEVQRLFKVIENE